MEICEIFGNTQQGEGPWAGYPCTFIRTSGCVPPYCKYCDSKYSWQTGKEMTVDELLAEVKKFNTKYVVITGGEPFVQDSVYALIIELMENGYKVQVETSGKYEIKELIAKNCKIVCSPKQYNNRFVIDERCLRYAGYFKFVVENKKEMDNVHNFIKEKKINNNKTPIYLMPKTVDYGKEKDKKIKKRVWEWCSQYGYRFSPRLQVDVFGKKRKV